MLLVTYLPVTQGIVGSTPMCSAKSILGALGSPVVSSAQRDSSGYWRMKRRIAELRDDALRLVVKLSIINSLFEDAGYSSNAPHETYNFKCDGFMGKKHALANASVWQIEVRGFNSHLLHN